MYNLTRFSIGDVLECSAALSKIGTDANSMEGAAQEIVNYLYAELGGPDSGEKACALVRFYKIHDFGQLPILLRGFARNAAGGVPLQPETKCLTLLATAGDRPEWNDRTRSLNHQAIPLLSEQMVMRSPMIAQMIQEMGLEIREVIAPGPGLLMEDASKRSYNVFYVPEALNSLYIPAQQDFVMPYNIRSVIGFGGLLPSKELFVVILFSKTAISAEAANLFKSIALSVKGSLLPFARGTVFAPKI